MADYVKMSRATLGILMAQGKILAETIPVPSGTRREKAKALMNRKLMYIGQEIILDDSIGIRQILAADAPAVGPNRFKAPSPRAMADDLPNKDLPDPKKLKREIIF